MIGRPLRWRLPRLPSLFQAPLPFAAGSAACFLLLSVVLAVPLAPRAAGPWKGYCVLLVRPETSARARLEDFLRREGNRPGGTRSVSARTQRVAYSDFEGLSERAVADLPAALDPADPRQDAWMRGVGGYFRLADGPRGWEAAYFPADSSPLLRFLRFTAVLGVPWGGSWRFTDFDPLAKLLALLVAAGYAVLVALAFGVAPRDAARLGAASALPWLLWILNGGLPELMLYFLGAPAWMRAAREVESMAREIHRHSWGGGDRSGMRSLVRGLASACGAAAVLLLVCGFSPGRLLEVLRLASGLFAALCAPVLLHWSRRGEPGVRFDPVTIVRRRPGRGFRLGLDARYRLPLALLVLLIPAAFFGLPLLRAPVLPTPRPVGGARTFSWEVLQAQAATAAEPGALPGIPQYILHLAYQEGLPFGRPASFPRRWERVQLVEYLSVEDPPRVVSRLRTVKVYDGRWVDRSLAAARRTGLERMLLLQGRPVAVVLRKPSAAGAAELPYLAAVLLALLAALLWDGERGLLPRARLRIFTVGGRV